MNIESWIKELEEEKRVLEEKISILRQMRGTTLTVRKGCELALRAEGELTVEEIAAWLVDNGHTGSEHTGLVFACEATLIRCPEFLRGANGKWRIEQ